MAFSQHDDVIQAFPPNRSDEAFCVRILPRRLASRLNLLNLERGTLPLKRLAIDRVPIANQVSGDLVRSAGLQKLLPRSGCGWVFGDVEMQNPPTVVA